MNRRSTVFVNASVLSLAALLGLAWAANVEEELKSSKPIARPRLLRATWHGLWERWRNPAGEFVETCTILTTKPNSLVADVHDRMPVILKPEDYDLWLDPGMTNVALFADTLRPFDPRLMKKYSVSTRVNRADNDDQESAIGRGITGVRALSAEGGGFCSTMGLILLAGALFPNS